MGVIFAEPGLLARVAAIMVLAGMVKGILGMGMPTVLLALLTALLGLPSAMALMLVPTVVTNLWQALAGGRLRELSRRLWPFLGASALAVWPGVWILASVDTRWLSLLLGLLLMLYGMMGLARHSLRLSERLGHACGAGALTGLLAGMTGSSVFPGVPWLQSIGLPREALIQAMGMLFCITTASLALALGERNVLTADLLLVSCIALAPTLVGMWLGQQLRRRLSEARFRQLFLFGIIVLGAWLVVKAA